MAVRNVTSAALTDVSSIDAGTTATPARLTAIEIHPHPQQVNTVYIQIFNALGSSVTLGTTAADCVIPVVSVSSQGAGTHAKTSGSAEGGPSVRKVLFPGGGVRASTSLCAAITTTSTGNTAASTTSLPGLVRYFYTPFGG